MRFNTRWPDKRHPLPGRSACFGLLLLLFAGCADSFIDPFENEARFYTLFGFIDVRNTEHVVRVIPVIRQSPVIVSLAQPEADIDAEVTSIDLDTGTVVEWEHVVGKLEGGTYAHLFRGRFRVVPGCTYRLIVTRSDGITATAETTVPVIPDTTLIQREPLRFSGDSSSISQTLLMPPFATPWEMDAVYRWEGEGIRSRERVPYGRVGAPGPQGWELTLNLSDDRAVVREQIRNFQAAGFLSSDSVAVLTGFGVEVELIDEHWASSGGVYDPNLFFEFPERSNVEHGYGFFGSIGLYVQEWNACDDSATLGYAAAHPDILGCSTLTP